MIIRLICCAALLASACQSSTMLRCPEGTKPDPEFVRMYIAALCSRVVCTDKTYNRNDAEDSALRMGYCE